MTTLSRKQREIREREEMFLDVSRRLLLERGYADLTMDQLAEATDYSKGVVYQHFKSKEDLITALAVQSMQRRVAWFERAVRFQGRTRERMCAIGVAEELFVRLHPHHFNSEQIIKLASLGQRASDERCEQLLDVEKRCFGAVLQVVDEALAAGDLTLAEPQRAQDVVLGLWALNFGGYTIMEIGREMLATHGVTEAFGAVRGNCHALLDGYGWKPLFREWDYDATQKRIFAEVFAEEITALTAAQTQGT